MGFTKLDDGLIFSSILREDDAVFKVWVLILSRTEKDGIARISPAFLASVCRKDDSEIERCLRVLESPDINSRSLSEDGRRIERVDGGFRAINYGKCRQRASPVGKKGPGEFDYNFRTIVGLIVIVSGLAAGIWLGWWLSTEGNIIDIIHDAKMALPEWAWVSLKIGLSVFAAAAFAGFLMALAITVFAGSDASGPREMRDRKRIW